MASVRGLKYKVLEWPRKKWEADRYHRFRGASYSLSGGGGSIIWYLDQRLCCGLTVMSVNACDEPYKDVNIELHVSRERYQPERRQVLKNVGWLRLAIWE